MDESANNMNASVAAALKTVLEKFNAMPDENRQDFLMGLVVVSNHVMRAIHGEEFVRSFLMGAIDELENPPMLQTMPIH